MKETETTKQFGLEGSAVEQTLSKRVSKCFEGQNKKIEQLQERLETSQKLLSDLGFRKDYETENKQLREELDEHAAFVYNQAILATPTGELRNKLTELNMLRLQALKGE